MKKILPFLLLACVAIGATAFYFYGNYTSQSENNAGEEKEKFTDADKHMNMWFWSRAYPDPTNLNEKYLTGWQQFLQLKENTNKIISSNATAKGESADGFGNWQSIGPNKTIGGRILTIAINPQNSNIIFIGSASGGIWKTTTGGTGTNAWKHVKTKLPVLGVASIIINPDNPNVMYAGTGEIYRVDTTGIGFNVWKTRGTYGIGIIKSSDGGNTWTQIFNKQNANMFGVESMQFDPTNSNIVYACTTDGLYRSTNAGSAWTKILNKIYVTDVAINPANTNVLVAAVGNLVNTDKGLYRSTDGGNIWNKITSGVPASFNGMIRMDNAGDSRLYASFANGTSANELYLSTDFGASWIAKFSSAHSSYQYWYCNDVAVDPTDINHLLMCGVGMYGYTSTSSTTGAGTLQTIFGIHSDIHDIAYDPINTNIAYVACDGGMYKSTNGGNSFTPINNGLGAVQFYASFGVSPTDPNIMIGGLQDNGVIKYNGTTWYSILGSDGGPTVFNSLNGNIAFTSTQNRTVYRSTNSGESWSNVLNGWDGDRTAFMAPVGISKSNPNYLYCASDNWHASTDGGITWSNKSISSTNYIDARYKTGIAIGVSPVNSQKAYVSTSPFSQRTDDKLNVNPPPNLFKSLNAGAANPVFTNVKNNLPDRFVMDFAFSPTNDDSVFIALGGYGTSHVYVTGNGGASWASIGAGLPDVPINALLIDPLNSQILYAGSDVGVYVSNNRGANWYSFTNGLWDATLVMDLQVTANNKLVAATHGKGVFVSDLFNGFVLPVRLLQFTGVYENGYNELNWKAENEINFSHYDVERSTDGVSFNKIATVAGAAASGVNNYSYSDNVKNISSAVYYYRLKMVNKDGSSNYSAVINTRRAVEKTYTLLNNPFSDKIAVLFNLSQREKITMVLYDAAGKLLRRQDFIGIAGTNQFELNNLNGLPKGNYVLNIYTGNEKFSEKMVK